MGRVLREDASLLYSSLYHHDSVKDGHKFEVFNRRTILEDVLYTRGEHNMLYVSYMKLTFAMKSSTCMEGGRLVFCFLVLNRSLLPLAMRCSIAVETQFDSDVKLLQKRSLYDLS